MSPVRRSQARARRVLCGRIGTQPASRNRYAARPHGWSRNSCTHTHTHQRPGSDLGFRVVDAALPLLGMDGVGASRGGCGRRVVGGWCGRSIQELRPRASIPDVLLPVIRAAFAVI